MIEMHIEHVSLNPQTNSGTITLGEAEQNRQLHIQGTFQEIRAVTRTNHELSNDPLSRLYGLLKNIILASGYSITRVEITGFVDTTPQGKIVLKTAEKQVELEALALDAIELAISTQTPILVAEEVLEQAAQMPAPKETSQLSQPTIQQTLSSLSAISEAAKLTEHSRNALKFAEEEARRFQHNYIGTEHLLLGLVHEKQGAAARALIDLGVDLAKVRSSVEFIIGLGDRLVLGEIGLTPRSKRVLELAIDEAHKMKHQYVGTEHLLLGLVREGEGIAAGILESLGVRLEHLRTRILKLLNNDS
ncbi:hypothetical protein EPA93_39085 [Ktedonosporobacter rubrisoli]|uniref:Clp R domain-containing protein n=1 Tax=Ktedonosporobacter rubrisoli TaxID=2509675 RepID=A0A4P6K0J3_KTERU|nr:bifunctional nuclease domain-containing protein [Ktedonosporobacter rubrisoli]QBD81657.1 hypothetical protein EPA93_39085 [Ktedonosporobacter rubrisoli]